MSEDERKLLASARNGNIEAYEKLIGPLQKKVYNIVLKTCGDGNDISELTQEVFLRVFKSLLHQQEDSSFILSIYKAVRDVCFESSCKIRMIS